MNSSGKRLIAFAQSILSTFRSFQHSMSSVTVYTHLCMMMCISKCIHLVYMNLVRVSSMWVYAHISTRWYDEILSTRFRCSYSIWDDEWWWESRLDFMMRTRLDFWELMRISTRKSYQNSTRFYVWIWGFFRPLGWQIARLMLRSLSQQHPDTFYTHTLWILYRLPHAINYCFIFKKPFFN